MYVWKAQVQPTEKIILQFLLLKIRMLKDLQPLLILSGSADVVG